jgi:hypothetical protein
MSLRAVSVRALFLPLLLVCALFAAGQNPAPPRAAAVASEEDPAAAAVAVRPVAADRPEQRLTEHDRAAIFDPKNPAPISPAFGTQPKQGRITGFDFARDPLNADKPFTTFER